MQLSGGEAIAAAVRANGIDRVFGLPGAQIYPLFDGFHSSGIEVLVPRHEQTAAYMAMGYAKSSGRTGVFAVVPGPGVLNTTAALCTAMGNCSPVLCLTGQVPSAYLGKGRGALHELRDQAGTLRSLIKDALPIAAPAAASERIGEALRLARGGRPGPVAVEMCWDTMAQRAEVELGGPAALDPPVEPDPDAVLAAARLIAEARKPMIMCGAGAQHAAAELRALAELLQAPVTAFRSGRGVVPEDHALGVASVAARELWDDVDLLIGIGSRLEMPYMRWSNPMRYEPKPSTGPRLVRIDIDPDEMERLMPDVAVVGDSAVVCRQLVDVLAARVRPSRDRIDEIATAKQTAATLVRRISPHAQYLEAIRAALPRDGFLVPELSQAGFTTYTGAFPVLEPRSYVTEGYQGTLGFGFPTALGVKAAHPDRAVVSITGDGGFMFAAQELATAAQYGLDLVVIVYNNGAFGNVLRDQQQQFDGHVIGSRLQNPDFVKLAESFGVAASRVAEPAALRSTLERALASGRPTLIEITLDLRDETSPWPLIHMQTRPSRLTL
jgi:acetolactate synthase-1/2/3 large subunit